MNVTGAESGLQSVERALSLLQLLASGGPVRVTQLAQELGVHKSTVSRLLATLERRGFADRVDDGARFVLGNGVALLAANAARPKSLTEASRQILSGLAQATGETVSLNVLTAEGDCLTVDQVLGSGGLTGFNWLGQRSPATATAAGKVLLAHRAPEEVKDLLPRKVSRFTDQTLSRDQLLAELPQVASRGFAVVRDELELGLSAISAPVFDSNGLLAALSASGPTVRIFGKRHRDMTANVVEAAAQISARMGQQPLSDRPAGSSA